MWKFIKFSLEFIVLWKFTIWFYNLLGLPVLYVLDKLSNIAKIIWDWSWGGSESSIMFWFPVGMVGIISVIVFLCIRYSKPSYYPYGY